MLVGDVDEAEGRSRHLSGLAGVLLAVATVAVVTLCFVEGRALSAPPQSNVRRADGEIRVFAISRGDLLDRAGLRAGDRILAVDGAEVASGRELSEALRLVAPGNRVHLDVVRGGDTLRLSAASEPNLSLRRSLSVLLPIVVLLAAGVGVLVASRGTVAAQLFLLWCTTSAVNDAIQLAPLGGDGWAQRVLIAAYTLYSLHSPALGLHLFVRFPERGRAQRWIRCWLPAAYAIQLALGLSYFLPTLSSWWEAQLGRPGLHAALFDLFNLNVVVCSGLSAVSLAVMAMGGSTDRVRLQARILFLGFLLLSSLQLALWVLPLRLVGRTLVSAEGYTLLDLVLPTTVAIAILFYRLFGIDLLIRQGFIYGSATGVVAVVVGLAAASLSWVGHQLLEDPGTVVVAGSAALAALLVQPVSRRVRWWVDRTLYRRRVDLGQLLEGTSKQLAALHDAGAAAALVRLRLELALEPDRLEVVVLRPPERIERVDLDGRLLTAGEIGDAAAVERVLAGRHRPFVPAGGVLSEWALVVPLLHGDTVQGAVLLGPRRDGLPYLADEMQLLAGLAPLAAAVLDSARLFEERQAAERLAMVGAATAAIAHELKNPLAAIKSTTAILRRRLGEDPRGRELTQVVEDEVDRLQKSVVEVLSFVRPPTVLPVPVSLGELLAQLVAVVEPDLARSGVAVTLCDRAPSAVVRGDPDRLRQAFLNLLLNAREALPAGGSVVVDVDPREPADGRVEVRVSDSGAGFSDEALRRASQPFFSTKRLGTGLGLANVRRTVEEHGGELELGNGPAGGAWVVVRLPLESLERRDIGG